MEIDFDASDRVSDFVTVPAGTYLCRVAEIRPGVTRAGDERWSLRLVVAEGQHVGKQAAWDSLVFSTRGRARARSVLHALGLPCSGRVQIEPADLEGRLALVEVRPVEYQAPNGDVVRRNEVPYDGFRPLAGEAADPGSTAEPRPGGNGEQPGRPTRSRRARSDDDEEPRTEIPF